MIYRNYIFIFSIMVAHLAFGQPSSSKILRQITVIGSAEVNILLDQIDLDITLQEYNWFFGGKCGIDQIEQEFLAVLTKYNIDKGDK